MVTAAVSHLRAENVHERSVSFHARMYAISCWTTHASAVLSAALARCMHICDNACDIESAPVELRRATGDPETGEPQCDSRPGDPSPATAA